MKVVLAPNALKGSLTATKAAEAMVHGVRRACGDADIVQVPASDGGDGLIDVLVHALGGELRTATITGPRGDPVDGAFGYIPNRDLAIIEMALASGLKLLPKDKRNPIETTTYGTGELIAAALNLGVSRIIVGLGGSATNDGGVGMAAALGVRFLDEKKRPVKPVGGNLKAIRQIDFSGLDQRVKEVRFEALCDVDNPLLGDKGAAQVFAPQKGATADQIKELEAGLANLAAVIEADCGVDVRYLPGAGAAGGLGAGLRGFVDATLRPGIEVVLELIGLEEKLNGADLVLTAEGQIDNKTASGKAPAGVAALAQTHRIPCIAIAGSVGEELEELYHVGIQAVFGFCPGPVSLEKAMESGAAFLTRTTEQVIRGFLAARVDHS